jgi:mono/diheme cytochrome c family protein
VWRPDPRRRAALLGLLLAPVLAAAQGTSGPALDYAVTCQGCHRADGAGTPGTVPALAGSVGKFLRVPGGREFLVRVPGVAQAPLDDAALAAVINWMLARFGGDDVPGAFAPYAAEEVGRLRQRPLTDVERERRELIEAIGRAR